jgi:hypothetical protein
MIICLIVDLALYCRIKPEIVAPGMAVESAQSATGGSGASTCATMAKSGEYE